MININSAIQSPQPIPLENPFALEKNHKKQNLDESEETQKQSYFDKLYKQSKNNTKYGIIRALEEEALKLAKERDEMFAREAKSKNPNKTKDPIEQRLKLFNPKLIDQKEVERQKKNYRIRTILKEKRETISEFVDKKREIFLSNMNITIKKEETNRLEDFIKNEQESLRARQLYFKNDCELVKKFMNDVKKQADAASSKADAEAKKRDNLKDEINQLQAQNERLRLQISKFQEEFTKLSEYKDFIEKLKKNYQSIFEEIFKSENQKAPIQKQQSNIVSEKSKIYLTDVDVNSQPHGLSHQPSEKELQQDEEQRRMAQLLIEILNHIQEKNLQYIQNQHDSEEDLEYKKREFQKLSSELENKQSENNERIKALERQKEQALKQQQVLNQLHKINSSKLTFQDGEDLDMEKIGKLILDIQREISKESRPKKFEKEIDSKEMHRAMTDIEKMVILLIDLRKHIMRVNKEFLTKKKLKEQEKKERQQQQREDIRIKEIEEKLRKKEEYLKNHYKGRKDMQRVYQVKKSDKKKVEVTEKVDDEEKYLQEDYELGNDIKQVGHLEGNPQQQQ